MIRITQSSLGCRMSAGGALAEETAVFNGATWSTFAAAARSWSACGRVVSLVNFGGSGTEVQAITIDFDSRGLMTRKLTDQRPATYSYDALQRMVSEHHIGYAPQTYTYNEVNNRVGIIQGQTLTTFIFDPGGLLLRSITGSQITTNSFDPRGNMIVIEAPASTTTYAYDGRGSTSSVLKSSGEAATFVYDGDAKRVGRVAHNGTRTTYIYSGDEMIEEIE